MPLHVEVRPALQIEFSSIQFNFSIKNCMMISEFMSSDKNISGLFVGGIRGSNNSSTVSE